MKEAPPAVRKIITAMVEQSLSRCDREGISWEDFHAAMLAEQAVAPKVSVTALFERTWKRLQEGGN